jgi:hypothetical protein
MYQLVFTGICLNFVQSFRESTWASNIVELYLGLLYHSTTGLSWPNIRFFEPNNKFKGIYLYRLAHALGKARRAFSPTLRWALCALFRCVCISRTGHVTHSLTQSLTHMYLASESQLCSICLLYSTYVA